MKPEVFAKALETAGFSPFTGIPCSVFKHLLNYIGDNPKIHNYLCSSEGEAMGLAAGFALSGKIPVVYMQNDGYGNAVNPISSLQLLYKLPALLLISWRGEPAIKDALQHRIMGKTILNLLDIFEIPYIILEDDPHSLVNCISAARDHCITNSIPFAFVIRKGYFDTYQRINQRSDSKLSQRLEYLKVLNKNVQPNDIFLGATGFSGREMYQTITHQGKLYMMGSMGCLASIGLGIAIQCPEKRVFVLDADGAILMKMGTLATMGHYKPDNLIHICFDNQQYESTGEQPSLSSTVHFPSVAKACGYLSASSISTIEDFQTLLENIGQYNNPNFIHIKINSGTDNNLGRPSDSPENMGDSVRRFLN